MKSDMRKNCRSEVEGRTVLADVVPINTPYVVGFFIGDVCNFKCKYCEHSFAGNVYDINKNLVPKFMDWDLFKKAADQLKTFPRAIKKILFSSIGEPLLNKDLPRMISYVKTSGITQFCEVVTNASLLTHDLSRQLIDSGLDRLCVSIQGVTAIKYKEICQVKIDYDKLISELTYFYHYSRGKCKVHIKTVDIALDKGEAEVFYQQYGNIADTINIDHVVPAFRNIDYSEMLDGNNIGLYGEPLGHRLVCPTVFYTLYILANGKVTTCCIPPYPVFLGNITDESILDMWNGKKHTAFLRYQLEGKRIEHPICQDCVLPNITNMHEDDLDERRENILNKLNI